MNAKNLLAMKTNVGAIVLAILGVLSACGVGIPSQWADIAVKTSVAVFALGVTIVGRIQAGARAPEATSIFGLIIQTADSLSAMLEDAAAANAMPPDASPSLASPSLATASQEPVPTSSPAPAEAQAVAAPVTDASAQPAPAQAGV